MGLNERFRYSNCCSKRIFLKNHYFAVEHVFESILYYKCTDDISESPLISNKAPHHAPPLQIVWEIYVLLSINFKIREQSGKVLFLNDCSLF